MSLSEQSGIKYWNLLVKRNWPYQQNGRFQDEAEANALERKMIAFLKSNMFPYETVTDVQDAMLELLS